MPILGEHRLVRERRRLARLPARVRPELVATGPGQVFSWDITKLAGPVKGTYFDAYVMIDIYSRLHRRRRRPRPRVRPVSGGDDEGNLWDPWIATKVVHADRGTSMTSKTVTVAVRPGGDQVTLTPEGLQ